MEKRRRLPRKRILVFATILTLMLLWFLAGFFRPAGSHAPVKIQGPQTSEIARFSHQFFFGLANAPAHVEDDLQDTWLNFAYAGKVAAYQNQAVPDQRLQFYTQPQIDLDLAADTGVTVFRMGIDWGRLCPRKPGSLDPQGNLVPEGIQDLAVLEHYRSIIAYARSRHMKVMLTLFHHSLPVWSMEEGGWANGETADHFIAFSADAAAKLGDLVDDWITLNEPNVFLLMTYGAGSWPPGIPGDFPGILNKGSSYAIAYVQFIRAHNGAYDAIHRQDTNIADRDSTTTARVGIAHFVSQYYASSLSDVPIVFASRNMGFVNDFPDSIASRLDFLGLNYYGEEVLKGTAPLLSSGREYSDSGRGIYPEGLYHILVNFNQRYNGFMNIRNSKNPLPFIITENGISDEDDIFRPSYLIEHLLAVRKAMDEGVAVQGYIFWTITDNWEWADGYGPKFGLCAVDRAGGLKRIKRPSYYLFQQIATTKTISQGMRDQAWNDYKGKMGSLRKIYRASDGVTPLDSPNYRAVTTADWRMPDHPGNEWEDATTNLKKMANNILRALPDLKNDIPRKFSPGESNQSR